ncbi:molybdate transport system ATP-binding protein ModC [Thermoanaerobacter kivui]|uniref:Molybdate transport system ATP-binding protein ModC n=1 Tax=Thermoanaerobacter kivui TaxID=2325 RepID=A0A097ATL0_THEKI|nr:ABC transporter ATP-binding protein [Thermoanaerobacter kivui]AIS53146.1 molybdate transport system ATP-binding protein ModC [Thermoanaerobacter kivui]
MLEIISIIKSFKERKVLKDVTLKIASEIKVIIGLNGSGKSTLLRIIAGIIKPDKGQIIINGQDVTMLPPEHREVGYVPQRTALFDHLTVKDNIMYPLKNGRGCEKTAERMIEMLGLKDYLHFKPRQLSGGYKSRASLARALVSEPSVMLLDEPFSEIDVASKEKLLPKFYEVLKSRNIPVLYVTHDVHEAELIGDRFAVMTDGELIHIGSASEAFEFIRGKIF